MIGQRERAVALLVRPGRPAPRAATRRRGRSRPSGSGAPRRRPSRGPFVPVEGIGVRHGRRTTFDCKASRVRKMRRDGHERRRRAPDRAVAPAARSQDGDEDPLPGRRRQGLRVDVEEAHRAEEGARRAARRLRACASPARRRRQALIAADPGKFFTEPHYNGYPAVLVRLDAIDERRAHRAADGRLALRRSAPARGRVRRQGQRTDDRRHNQAGRLRSQAWPSQRVLPGPARRVPPTSCCSRSCCCGRATSRPCATPSTASTRSRSRRVRFGLGAALYALVVWWRERSLRIARRDFGAILLLAVDRHLRQPGRGHLRRAEGRRRQRRHAHGERADHRRAARAQARARAHRRAARARHRRRGHGRAARALRRRGRRRRAADRLDARARDGRDVGDATRCCCAR